ncbi:hypothetical protein NQ318_004476 [Aromia moschata]|uniref:beta-glucosidase n=1 Tax=Aromia moschata TaxID=1265417 RepID=A0AAV8X224_9CUCU|nr:hypothetical protein NQ318_004476 [Aromia moschata]
MISFKCQYVFTLACLLLPVCVLSSKKTELLNKNTFPEDFLFGVSTSAYQTEGGYNANGKGQSIWDYYTKKYPKKFHNSSNGNVACDSFKKFKEDVQLVKNLGVHFYRFSIAWSRILPDGFSHNVNKDGLRYYNDLINELLAKGIQPMVTMYHYDLPMTLQEIGGWTNPYLAYYFEDYARILYSYFGDRVKHWITLNGACPGYGDDVNPPFLNHSGIANYLCIHVTRLAHAKAYHLYDNEFRSLQKGKVGIVIEGNWYEAGSFAVEDIEAAERMREFKIGLYANPIFYVEGDYPLTVRQRVGNVSRQEGYLQSRLPIFSPPRSRICTGYNVKEDTSERTSVEKDMRVRLYQDDEWPKSGSNWLRVEPTGLRKALRWIRDKYEDPDIIITENGFSDKGETNDINRIKYYQKYLSSLLEAIHEDEVKVKAFAAWSLLDNFEWISGYSEKFGLYHVNFSDPKRKRTAKKSVEWYKNVITHRRIVDIKEISSRLKGDL